MILSFGSPIVHLVGPNIDNLLLSSFRFIHKVRFDFLHEAIAVLPPGHSTSVSLFQQIAKI